MPEAPLVTLAICTRDRTEELVRTLAGIGNIRFSGPWELLIVDNGQGDCEGVGERASPLDVETRCIREARRGVSYARNRALEEARGEILVFIDDDVDCAPALLEEHLRAFFDPSVHATGGRIVPRLPPGAPDWLRQCLREEIGGPTARYDFGDKVLEVVEDGNIREGLSLPFTCNCGLRRSLAVQVGGFRTDLGWSAEGKRIGGEDTDLFLRMSRLGGRILYLPEARVVHRIPEERTTKSYYRQWNIAYGRASIRMKARPGLWKGLGMICEQLIRYVRYTFMPGRLLGGSVAKRYRKKYSALGKILEILR